MKFLEVLDYPRHNMDEYINLLKEKKNQYPNYDLKVEYHDGVHGEKDCIILYGIENGRE